MRTRAIAAVVVLTALVALAGAPSRANAAADEFPTGYEAYHTYTEVVAELDAAVTNYPSIVRKFSLGQSYQGREIWALKISDNVDVDEDEPEVLSVSLIHSREHITTEMNLYLMNVLLGKYATSPRIRNIVDTREIFVVPVANPDGAEWDIASGDFRRWRKNRQPNEGTTAVGTDVNRNFGFKWGCCKGSSGDPSSLRYRGPAAWSAPETRRLRDFINSRVVGGRQQIKAIFNWHSYGELVMWPYGYTKTDIPKTMTADDHATLVALGTKMAELNGYRPMQGSDLYIYSGDFVAWAYGVHRIVGFTFEMYPPHGANAGGFYPDPSVIGPETRRNRTAALYLLEQAACPYRAAGLGGTHCGPLNDDFETRRGWTVNPAGTDTASTGAWERAVPQATSTAAGVKQRSGVTSGRMALITGARAGATANDNDVDGGLSSILSPAVELGAGQPWTLSFRYYLAHAADSSSLDFLRLRVVGPSGDSTVFAVRGEATERNARWRTASVDLSAYAGSTVRLLFEAADNGAESLLEAAVDDVRVYQTPPAAGASTDSDERRVVSLVDRAPATF
ncbi:MAG TPA: M14 family zinc carboxypeptidase [Candidatus Caenarcaniphilales bacterium]|nr:M14 family zinc carboxypeptidase [Candidatus Caenarcaniphilales bacterium]